MDNFENKYMINLRSREIKNNLKLNSINFERSLVNLINQRISVRSYLNKPIEDDLRQRIKDLIENTTFYSPFSDRVGKLRFELFNQLDLPIQKRSERKIIGSTSGAHDFIIGAIEKSEYNFEHYGYVLETIILKLTELELGTCWLGIFDRDLFANLIKKKPDEIVPAITPIGIPRINHFRLNKNFRKISHPRYLPEYLFFEGDFTSPLHLTNNDEFLIPLEMIRIGPSASNLQPWRILKEKDEKVFHFYTLSTRDRVGLIYNNFRRIDIGIAVSHFDLTVRFFDIKGIWEFNQPLNLEDDNLKYIISWRKID